MWLRCFSVLVWSQMSLWSDRLQTLKARVKFNRLGSFKITCQQRRLRCTCILWSFPTSVTIQQPGCRPAPLLSNNTHHYSLCINKHLTKTHHTYSSLPNIKIYNLLSWENLIKYVDVCLMYRIIYGLTSLSAQNVNIRKLHISS